MEALFVNINVYINVTSDKSLIALSTQTGGIIFTRLLQTPKSNKACIIVVIILVFTLIDHQPWDMWTYYGCHSS